MAHSAVAQQSGFASAAPVRLSLPAPTGRHQIGSTSLHLADSTRQDPWKADRTRELMVTITYPTRDVAFRTRAEHMSAGVAAAFDRSSASPDFLNIPEGSVDWAATRRHAYVDAPVDRLGGKRPVVLFSPGLGTNREHYAVLIDDLASHGYLVVSMSHIYETSAVEFPGGRVELQAIPGVDVVTLKTAIDARVADSRFVLDQLTRLNAGENPDVERRALPHGLAGALDLSAIGMFGHSYGGYAVGETMYHDRRITAGLNLDGSMAHGFGDLANSGMPYLPGEVTKHGLDRPFMLMGSNLHSHLSGSDPFFRDQSWIDFWSNQGGWKRDVTLLKSAHNSYTDYQTIVPQLGSLVVPDLRALLIGDVEPTRSLTIQHAYVGAFFDLHLRDRDNHLLDGPSGKYPEIRFVA